MNLVEEIRNNFTMMDIENVYNYLVLEFENNVNSTIKDEFISWLDNARKNAIAFLSNKDDGNYICNFPEDGMLICNIASDLKGQRVKKGNYTSIFNSIDYSLLDGNSFSHELFEDAIKDNRALHHFCDWKCDSSADDSYVRIITVYSFVSYYPKYSTGTTPSYTSKDAAKVFEILKQPNNEFCNKEYRFTADVIRNLIWVADKNEFEMRKKIFEDLPDKAATYLISCLGIPMPAKENHLIYFLYPESFAPEMFVPIAVNAKWGNNEVFYLSYSCKDSENWGRTRTYKDDNPSKRMKERVHIGGDKDVYHICSPYVLGVGEYNSNERNNIVNDAMSRFENI